MELSLWHTFDFFDSYILVTWCLNTWYFKLTLFDLTEFIVWNVKGLRHKVAKKLELEYQSLWQRLKYFVCYLLFPPLPDPTVFYLFHQFQGKFPEKPGKIIRPFLFPVSGIFSSLFISINAKKNGQVFLKGL